MRTANKKGGGWEFIIFISIIDQVAGRLRSENGPIKSSSERRSLPAGQHLPAWVTSGCLSVADFFKLLKQFVSGWKVSFQTPRIALGPPSIRAELISVNHIQHTPLRLCETSYEVAHLQKRFFWTQGAFGTSPTGNKLFHFFCRCTLGFILLV